MIPGSNKVFSTCSRMYPEGLFGLNVIRVFLTLTRVCPMV